MARGRLRAAVGIRREARALPGGVHDPDAAAGHDLLRGNEAGAAGAPLGRLRHASRVVGAGTRRRTVLRALLRNLAPLDSQPRRAQERMAVASRGRSAERAVPPARPDAVAAHDEDLALPSRARAGGASRGRHRRSGYLAALNTAGSTG